MALLCAVAIAHALDPLLTPLPARWFRTDVYNLFRNIGFMPLWLIVAGLVLAADSARLPKLGIDGLCYRSGLLLFAPLLSGLSGEAIKVLIRRRRPPQDGSLHYHWDWPPAAGQSLWEMLRSGGFGLPSTHASVAFGGCLAVAMLWPRTWPIALLLACGCALTRLQPDPLNPPHYFSDVTAGAALGIFCCLLLYRSPTRRMALWQQPTDPAPPGS